MFVGQMFVGQICWSNFCRSNDMKPLWSKGRLYRPFFSLLLLPAHSGQE
jgi:hypothetical protein